MRRLAMTPLTTYMERLFNYSTSVDQIQPDEHCQLAYHSVDVFLSRLPGEIAYWKWVRQIAAQCRMPPGLPRLFQELLIYESVKTTWCQSFNRFAGMLLREQNKKFHDYWSANAALLPLRKCRRKS